jgi:RNA polymerase sigma factor (sigma-70 family)
MHAKDVAQYPVATKVTVDWQAALSEHGRWLRTVVAARLGEPQAVDEVMQEVALAAVRQAAPIADPSKVGPWLYQLAVRQALMYRRSRGRARNLLHRYAEQIPLDYRDNGRDPLGWLIDKERRGLVRKTIRELPRRDAEILLLKYTEDWSYEQIGRHLGLSRNAVESRLFRARQRLRKMLLAAEQEESVEGVVA